MLVLSRKIGERILIGDGIAITVVRIGQRGVRIGIEAPKEMTVVREELSDGKLKDAEPLELELDDDDSVLINKSATQSPDSFEADSDVTAKNNSRILPR